MSQGTDMKDCCTCVEASREVGHLQPSPGIVSEVYMLWALPVLDPGVTYSGQAGRGQQ